MADDQKTTNEPNPTLTNVVPWGLHPVPKFVQTTLKRRPKSYAWHSTSTSDTGATRTAWARVCSNGKVAEHHGLDGFILFGPNTDTVEGEVGFNEAFGVGPTGKQIIGRDVNNVPHTLSPITFPHRPPPALQAIETEFYGAGSSFPGLCKKATIKWKCFSMEQLEYLTPYFLSLGVSAVLEWGWNTFANSSLINLKDIDGVRQLFRAGDSYYKRIKDSNGDYDCHVGRIIDYGYTMDNQGNYEGYTVVVNPAFMMEGINIKDQVGISESKGGSSSAIDFMKTRFDNLIADDGVLPKRFSGKELELAKMLREYNWIFKNDPKYKYHRIRPDAKFWINMRGLQAILNLFGSVKYNGGNHRDLVFRFSNAKIGAHPLMKAVCAGSDNKNVNVLIPNAIAPRLTRGGNGGPSNRSLKTVVNTAADERLAKTAMEMSNTLTSTFKLSDETDHLQSIIGSVNPFPMLVGGGIIPEDDPTIEPPPTTTPTVPKTPMVDPVYNAAKPGYWGFLGDIYVSNTLVKTAFTQNDTLQRALEYILGEISSAGSNYWEFRVIPEQPNNITVVDSAFCPITVSSDVRNANLVDFTIGKTEDSCFTDYGMSVQMKQEMATQTLLNRTSTVDAKGSAGISQFVSGDRLFDPGSFDYAVEETDADKKNKEKQLAEKTAADAAEDKDRKSKEGFVILNSQGVEYYLTEKNPEVMKKIVSIGERGESTKPLSTPMMPGTEFTFDCQGISGFAFLGMFTLSAVPTPYNKEHAVFQVDGVKNIITENNWKTSITAKVRPLVTAS